MCFKRKIDMKKYTDIKEARHDLRELTLMYQYCNDKQEELKRTLTSNSFFNDRCEAFAYRLGLSEMQNRIREMKAQIRKLDQESTARDVERQKELKKEPLYRIPEELINKDNVQIVYSLFGGIEVKLSTSLKDEIAKWPERKQKAIIYDLKTSIRYAGLYGLVTLEALEEAYHQLFITLRQVY